MCGVMKMYDRIRTLRKKLLQMKQNRIKAAGKQTFKFFPFSDKQKKVLAWWCDASPVHDKDGIIADGAIRSGKTVSMSLSFVMWAMSSFQGQNFAMCGKTIGSFRRNVLFWLKLMLRSRGYSITDHRADNLLVVRRNGIENYFYIFGGKDERSQDLIQGITLAGVFFDEVALMPESFVNQATGRCSVKGSKFWFNCNPDGPYHWFKVNWIDKCKEKNILYLHFTMDDNLSLDPKVKQRYENLYTGVFYDRFIRGLWKAAEGAVYPQFANAPEQFVLHGTPPPVQYAVIGVDYGGNGSAHAFVCNGILPKYRGIVTLQEYYRKEIISPSQLEQDFVRFCRSCLERWQVYEVFCDSAEQTLIQGFRRAALEAHLTLEIRNARKGSIKDRIAFYNLMMSAGRYHVMDCCPNLIEAFETVTYNPKSATDDRLDNGTYNIDSLDANEYSTETIMEDMIAVG